MGSLRSSAYCRNTILITILSIGIGFGYDISCLNSLIPVIKSIYNTTYYNRHDESLPDGKWTLFLSLTMSLLLAGAFIGSLIVDYVLKILSRKNSLSIFHFFRVIGALIICLGCGISGSYEAFLIGRTIVGLSVGVLVGVSFVYISELCIEFERGKFMSLFGIGITIGNIFGPVLSHFKVFGTLGRWMGVPAFSALPSVIFLCCVYWLPMSPFVLLRTSRAEEVHQSVFKLRSGNEHEILLEIEHLKKEHDGDRETTANSQGNVNPSERITSVLIVLKVQQYRRQLFTVCFVYVGGMMSGINHVYLFSDQILLRAGIPEDRVTYITIGLFVAQFLAAVVGYRILKKYGSRHTLLGTLIIILISHVVTVTSTATQHLSAVAGYFSILGLLLTLIGNASGPNLTMFALLGELTTDPTRPIIVNYSGGCVWFFAWLSGFISPYLDASMGPYSMIFWVVCCLAYLSFTYFFIPETKGKSVEEIQKFFKKYEDSMV